MKLQNIKLKNILVNNNQPRKYFDEYKLEELKESIKHNGLIQPIIVREMGNNKYEIVAGERRFRACELLEYESIQGIVIEAGNSKSYEYAVLENIQRENLNVIEEAESYIMLMEVYGYNQEELAVKLGKTRTSIANKIRLLKLPELVKDYVRKGELSYGQGRTLLGIKENKELERIAKKVVEKKYTVRDIEKIVKKFNYSQDEKIKIFKNKFKEDFDIEKYEDDYNQEIEEKKLIEDKLRELFETKVSVKGNLKEEGKIEINYYDYEDLVRIISVLNINFE